MQTWQVAALVLLAVLVGALLPSLYQLRKTLQSTQTFLEATGRRLDRALDEVTDAAARINRLGKTLEQDAEGLRVLTDAAAGLGRSLKQAQESLHMMAVVGGAVGPALVAGLRAWFSPAQPSGPESPIGVETESGTTGAAGAERETRTTPRHEA